MAAITPSGGHQESEFRALDPLATVRRAKGRSEGTMKQGQAVLEVLCASPVPLSAYDILGRLQSENRIAPTQVYRILDSLQESGLIHKLASRPAFVLRSFKADNAKGAVFMVCNHCGGVQQAPCHATDARGNSHW